MKNLFKLEITGGFQADCGDLCGVESDSNDHPNKMSFTGTLLLVDEPSTRPPNGAEGHKILVPKDIAKKNLDSLIGMGINYQPNQLSGHQPRHKVGVITKAWLDGNKVQCSGTIWQKDFPEAKTELKKKNLGMSMELANVLVKNKHDPIWKLMDFSFTGATILYKDAAAYQKTSLSASIMQQLQNSLTVSAERLERIITRGDKMGKTREKEKRSSKKTKTLSGSSETLGNLVTAIRDAVKNGITESFKPINKQISAMSASIEDHGKIISDLATANIHAGADSSDNDVRAGADSSAVDSDDELEAGAMYSNRDSSSSSSSAGGTVKGARKSADDESSTNGDSESSSDDVDAELEKLSHPAKGLKAPASTGEESSDPDFGNLNKGAKSKGHKTEVSASAGVRKVIEIAAAANKRIKTIKAEAKKLRLDIRAERKQRKALEAEVEDMQAQIEDFTNAQVPRALPGDLRMLLTKGGHDPAELMSSGRKLTVAEVDEMFAASGLTLHPRERMEMKNKLLEKNLMEQGEMQPAHLRNVN